ncbi:hypothetical protein BV898_03189 [Hypsibius exemplaris]|uniref:Uncharacterized protein n=1 Tax=Hypsibius exemplaris TaxID=2072580 RepID=A0A1W0X5Y6_HYPEX|nr:hypothetical protein BV898_03189 [Hypsibius exemplaris]
MCDQKESLISEESVADSNIDNSTENSEDFNPICPANLVELHIATFLPNSTSIHLVSDVFPEHDQSTMEISTNSSPTRSYSTANAPLYETKDLPLHHGQPTYRSTSETLPKAVQASVIVFGGRQASHTTQIQSVPNQEITSGTPPTEPSPSAVSNCSQADGPAPSSPPIFIPNVSCEYSDISYSDGDSCLPQSVPLPAQCESGVLSWLVDPDNSPGSKDIPPKAVSNDDNDDSNNATVDLTSVEEFICGSSTGGFVHTTSESTDCAWDYWRQANPDTIRVGNASSVFVKLDVLNTLEASFGPDSIHKGPSNNGDVWMPLGVNLIRHLLGGIDGIVANRKQGQSVSTLLGKATCLAVTEYASGLFKLSLPSPSTQKRFLMRCRTDYLRIVAESGCKLTPSSSRSCSVAAASEPDASNASRSDSSADFEAEDEGKNTPFKPYISAGEGCRYFREVLYNKNRRHPEKRRKGSPMAVWNALSDDERAQWEEKAQVRLALRDKVIEERKLGPYSSLSETVKRSVFRVVRQRMVSASKPNCQKSSIASHLSGETTMEFPKPLMTNPGPSKKFELKTELASSSVGEKHGKGEVLHEGDQFVEECLRQNPYLSRSVFMAMLNDSLLEAEIEKQVKNEQLILGHRFTVNYQNADFLRVKTLPLREQQFDAACVSYFSKEMLRQSYTRHGSTATDKFVCKICQEMFEPEDEEKQMEIHAAQCMIRRNFVCLDGAMDGEDNSKTPIESSTGNTIHMDIACQGGLQVVGADTFSLSEANVEMSAVQPIKLSRLTESGTPIENCKVVSRTRSGRRTVSRRLDLKEPSSDDIYQFNE